MRIGLLMWTLLVTAASAWSLTACSRQQAVASNAQLQQVTLGVENMTCAMCPITVRKALEQVPGVQQATVDFERKTATVRFDADVAEVQALVQAVGNAGYPSSVTVGPEPVEPAPGAQGGD